MGQRPAVGAAGRRASTIVAGALVLAGLTAACAATPMTGSPTTGVALSGGAASTASTTRSTVSSTAASTPIALTTGTDPTDPGSSTRTSADSGWTPLLQPTADLPADHPGLVAQQAMTQVDTVRTEGTSPFGSGDLATDSVSVYRNGLVSAREAWVESSQGGLLGYLGVDGRLWDKQLGRADADRDTATWRPLDAPGVSAGDRLAAAAQTRLGGRIEAVDYLLAVPDPQPADTATVNGRPATRWTGRAPIEALYPGQKWGTSPGDVAGWDVDVWLADDGRPLRLRAELVDRAGRDLGTSEETYRYDGPGDTVTTPAG